MVWWCGCFKDARGGGGVNIRPTPFIARGAHAQCSASQAMHASHRERAKHQASKTGKDQDETKKHRVKSRTHNPVDFIPLLLSYYDSGPYTSCFFFCCPHIARRKKRGACTRNPTPKPVVLFLCPLLPKRPRAFSSSA